MRFLVRLITIFTKSARIYWSLQNSVGPDEFWPTVSYSLEKQKPYLWLSYAGYALAPDQQHCFGERHWRLQTGWAAFLPGHHLKVVIRNTYWMNNTTYLTDILLLSQYLNLVGWRPIKLQASTRCFSN